VQQTSTSQGPAATPARRLNIGAVVAGSLATGLVAALLLPFVPFISAEESAMTGAVLCGFALGWAMLAMLSARFTDQPQRWATVPAVFMGLSGLLLIAFGAPVHRVLDWVWPLALLALAIWMFLRVRRELHSRGGRWLLYPVIAFLALASIGGAYATIGAAADSRAYPMSGQLIDVGGHRLHLNCTGSGSPTVVLQPGGGDMASSLGWIAPAVAQHTRVCVYDRAGRAWSEPADNPQDAIQVATDLHTLLQTAHVAGPYVMAGHSFGGLYTLAYAARYPDDLSGMVLIDATNPASSPNPGATSGGDASTHGTIRRISTLVSLPARLGLARLYAPLAYGDLPPQSRDEVRAQIAKASNFASSVEEFAMGGSFAEQGAALQTFGDKALVVLTAGIGSDATHQAAQNQLATLSTNSAHHVIQAVHEDLITNERAAAETTQGILDAVEAVRSHAPVRQ
jgi:pimeloyl-ACP methyl ester carboxylesterase